jgi:hypothetical protein
MTHTSTTIRAGWIAALAGLALLLGTVTPARAIIELEVGGVPITITNLATVGGLWRMQDRDLANVGKPNVAALLGNDPICVGRVGDDGISGPGPRGSNTFFGNTCNPQEMTDGRNANTVFLEQPGSLSPNGDNGNLNFDRYDVVHAASKLTTDINFTVFDANVFVRTLALFDVSYNSLDEFHPDTTMQARDVAFSSAGKEAIARELRFLDAFISRGFEVGDRFISLKIGQQVINWGESAFLVPNSLNALNPADQSLLRVPGFDIRELQRPLGMVTLNMELVPNLNMELFYGYEWRPVSTDPAGSFFSISDTLGDGGTYAMLSFSKAPEDPGVPYTPTGPDDPYQFPVRGVYQPASNPDDPAFILNSKASRTLQRDLEEELRRRPKDTGQYGAAFRYFAENFNNGTEFGFYFANYHARIPSVSGFAAADTCLPGELPPGGIVTAIPILAVSCQADVGELLAVLGSGSLNPQLPLAGEALPLDTARLFVEYPEDIRMYGMSFNTTVGNFALAGEYVYRDNLPIQAHTVDLTFALLQPAFPENDLDVSIAVLPGRRTAVPDFLQTTYRGEAVQAGQYVRGWEPMNIGQANLNISRLLGAAENPFGASQMTLLLELGYTHLPGFPSLGVFQTNGAGTDTHISAGADGSVGLNPADIRSNPDDPTSDSRTNAALLQNPVSHLGIDVDGFGTQQSYGYRLVTLARYTNAIFGANVELLNAFFHDVGGVGPGLGQNFVEGRKQILSGIRWDYQERFIGELRYTWFTGGQKRDALRDRDNLLLFVGYQF